MSARMHNGLLVTLGLGAVLASCTAISWPFRITEETPVRSIVRPENYIRGNFGSVVVAVSRPAHGSVEEAQYVAMSGGGDTPTAFYLLSTGDSIGGGRVHTYASDIRHEPYLSYFTGAALASTAVWDYLPELDRACVIIGEPGLERANGGFTRYCLETQDTENPRRVPGSQFRTLAPSVPERLGRSLAVLSDPGTVPGELRYLVLGANGSVHLMNNRFGYAAAPSLEVDVSIEAADYGVAVAAGTLSSDWPAWVAVGSSGRVYVFGIWDDPSTPDPDPDHHWLQACWESSGREDFGTRLWSGDVDGDGRDDLAIGADPVTAGRSEDLVVVDGTEFWDGLPPDPYPTVSACMDVPESIVFTCGDFPDRDVVCGPSPGFGSSFAVGDLDGDGTTEVVLGAPYAQSAGKTRAGAVLIYDPSSPSLPISALRDAQPEGGARLGTAVAVAEIAGFEEVVAGSPGTDEVFVFYCSGVGTDTPYYHDDVRCR